MNPHGDAVLVVQSLPKQSLDIAISRLVDGKDHGHQSFRVKRFVGCLVHRWSFYNSCVRSENRAERRRHEIEKGGNSLLNPARNFFFGRSVG
jgi:hypothetical protein